MGELLDMTKEELKANDALIHVVNTHLGSLNSDKRIAFIDDCMANFCSGCGDFSGGGRCYCCIVGGRDNYGNVKAIL